MATIEWPPYHISACNINPLYPNTLPPAQGWQCPVCKAVYAPSMPCCMHCRPQQVEYSSGRTTDGKPKK